MESQTVKNLFPFTEEIDLNSSLRSTNLKVHYQIILDLLGSQITKERKERIRTVIEQRTFDIAVVCESLYDRGNTSAVMRSAEAFGFSSFHVIENGEKFKKANRVTRGAEKWLEIRKWTSTNSCCEFLKKERRQLVVTSLDANINIEDIDFSKPTAIVMGNENSGVSEEMLGAADFRIKIPMYGFVQSFNISVAAALCLYHISQYRKLRKIKSELSTTQKKILEALYILRTLDSAEQQIEEFFRRKEILS